MASLLDFVIRTPHQVAYEAQVSSARVPTESGQVGLRAREEPLVLVVEPGLVVLRLDRRLEFAATAGGLLEADRATAILYTPFATTGALEDEVLAALDRALATPDSELAARRKLAELEQHIVQQLRSRPPRLRGRR